MGLKNVPSVFQQVIDIVLRPCDDYAKPYMDDILVYSERWEKHILQLKAVLTELQKHRLTCERSKCKFGMAHVEYLRHIIGSGIIAVPRMKISAMADFRQPITQQDLRAFLGYIGYYRAFIPHFSSY